jgi:hypothetical protein
MNANLWKTKFYYWWCLLKINPVLTVHKYVEENKKMQLKFISIVFTNFIVKELFLHNTWKSPAEPNLGLRWTQFE